MDFSFVRHAGYKWHDDVLAAVDHIDQGSVVREVPIVYSGAGKYAVLPNTSAALGEKEGGVKLTTCDVMVTSQTCDIRGPGGKKSALLNVAPVYPLKLYNESTGVNGLSKVAFLELLTGDDFADVTYIVDFRFETAIEKSIFVGRKVSAGFKTGGEAAEFAKKLGEYRRRGAFDPKIETSLIPPIRDLFTTRLAPDDVYEVRVFADPSVSRATDARLIVACYADTDVPTIAATIGQVYDDIRTSQSDLNLLPLVVKSVDDLTVAEIMGSVPIYFRDLSNEQPAA